MNKQKHLYLSLAWETIQNHAPIYLPYILTVVFCFASMYNLALLAQDDRIVHEVSQTLSFILDFGVIVIGILTVILISYAQSFVMKKRQKELGLYTILGMEKKHLGRIIAYELCICATIGVIGGIICGVSFTKLSFLLQAKLLDLPTVLSFVVSIRVVWHIVLLFGAIFLLQFLTMIVKVARLQPIELLQASAKGEKEPKVKWFMAVLGAVILAGGYLMSILTADPLAAIQNIFIAVILVIVGTYSLFMVLSIVFLKYIKKIRRVYYQPHYFLIVSGMLYRMRRNAVGLASISILSTMLLVTLGMTSSLYFYAQKGGMKDFYYHDVSYSTITKAGIEQIKYVISQKQKDSGVILKDQVDYQTVQTVLDSSEKQMSQMVFGRFITKADYERLSGSTLALNEHEVAVFGMSKDYPDDTIVLGQQEFQVTQKLQQFPLAKKLSREMARSYWIVLQDQAMLEKIYQAYHAVDERVNYQYAYSFNISNSAEEALAFTTSVRDEVGILADAEGTSSDLQKLYISDYYQTEFSFKNLNGSFMFIGIFLGLIFLLTTVVIIYYKQITEGYEDVKQYRIMQKIGLEDRKLRQVIRWQVLSMFFMPLGVAIIHTLVSTRMTNQILLIFGIMDTTYIYLCLFVTIALFGLIYFVIFTVTSKQYYKIVRE